MRIEMGRIMSLLPVLCCLSQCISMNRVGDLPS